MKSPGKQWIRNFEAIATSEGRRLGLELVKAGLDAIETERVLRDVVALEGNELRVRERAFDLSASGRVYVFGVGKTASRAAVVLEAILGERIAGGVVIGSGEESGGRIMMFRGDHPLPSTANVAASGEMAALAGQMQEEDLALVVVSGGGSAHLCWPQSEAEQGRRLYQDFVRAGGTIVELNTVRKHLSLLKGGGLAKLLYPATVVGLIFSDVPGDRFPWVASGPTYRDESTVEDAKRILEAYRLDGYELRETPKDGRYFAKVSNFVMVSNQVALGAMRARALELGVEALVVSDVVFDPVALVAGRMFAAAQEGLGLRLRLGLRKGEEAKGGFGGWDVILAGGEPEVKVPDEHGRGGRNQLLALHALSYIKPGQVFLSFGSDGQDNGPAAGAIVDGRTREKARGLGLDPLDYLRRFDAETFFEKTGDQIITGPTGANVSDLMLLMNPTSAAAAGRS